MKNQHGQVLLITIMLLATALTVVLSLSFRSTTETQITKLQEENQKALAAAEAGIDASLKSGTAGNFNAITGLSGLSASGINMSDSQVSFNNANPDHITTVLLQKDEQYTFYLSTPGGKPPGTPDFSTFTPQNFTGDNIIICTTSSTAAMEITLIKQGTPAIVRYAVNPVGSTIIQNASDTMTTGNSGCPSDATFSSYFSFSSTRLGNNTELMIVRLLNDGGKIGIKPTSGTLPLQGKTVTSTAQSDAGPTKIVQLFQSYPQIPADFFVTSF